MKFHQLPAGSRFEFEGEIYSKSGTLKAIHEQSGHLRVIRRSATVRPLEGPGPVPLPAGATEISTDTVRTAFEAFCDVCEDCLNDALSARSEGGIPSTTRRKFDMARQRFLSSLNQRRD